MVFLDNVLKAHSNNLGSGIPAGDCGILETETRGNGNRRGPIKTARLWDLTEIWGGPKTVSALLVIKSLPKKRWFPEIHRKNTSFTLSQKLPVAPPDAQLRVANSSRYFKISCSSS